MTFESHYRNQMTYKTDFELQAYSNGGPPRDIVLADAPLPQSTLRGFAQDELDLRFEQQLEPVDPSLDFGLDDPLDFGLDDPLDGL